MRRCHAISVSLALVAACAGSTEQTRSLNPVSPLRFVHRVEVRAPGALRPRNLRRNGDSVTTGDRLQVVVTAKEDVYLYLGYCDGREFALFPSQGSLRGAAGRETRVPPGPGAFEISGDAASEVLYVILSKTELSLASPDLAVKIAGGSGAVDGDCAGQMRDPAGAPIPPQQPVDVRPSTMAIEVVRYQFKHQVSPARPR